MKTRTINGYEIAGNECLAIAASEAQPNISQIFVTKELLATRVLSVGATVLGNAFIEALYWVDPTLKDAKYTCWGEPFHTLEDVSNDSRCAYSLESLIFWLPKYNTLDEAVAYG